MAWAVALVARRARCVTLLRSLSEAASRPASSMVSILARKTWSKAIEWQCRIRLSSRQVGTSSKCRCGSARLGRMTRPCLQSDSRGQAEMCGHGLIQRRQVLVSCPRMAVLQGGRLIVLSEEDGRMLSLW